MNIVIKIKIKMFTPIKIITKVVNIIVMMIIISRN